MRQPSNLMPLDDAEEERLARHYSTRARGGRRELPKLAGSDSGAEMIRSQDEVMAGATPMQPTERVRLRKVLVTERVTRNGPRSPRRDSPGD
jgi:hypothetical protein